ISTVVPNREARSGVIPDPANPGQTITVPVSPAVLPYLLAYPQANGEDLGGGLAAYSFPFDQQVDQDYFQVRLDQTIGERDQLFVRYTRDKADQLLPTDFPQFPRTFISRNQFATAEYRRVMSPSTLGTVRLGWSRTRIGQNVEAEVSGLPEFVAGRGLMGDIDIGGVPRFGPQSSANLRLRQDVFSLATDLARSRGRHLLKGGLLAERYRDTMFNPTFSLGIYTFPNLEAFLRGRPQRFIGITPAGDMNRAWDFTLLGAYLQDDVQVARNFTLNVGLRYEFATRPEDEEGRDINMPDLSASQVTIGPLYERGSWNSLSPRLGFAWDVTGDDRTAVRGGYGLYFHTNNHQNLIVTVTNPPATPRPVIVNPTFPNPDFNRAGALSIRPMQWDMVQPRVHVWNLSLQRALPLRTVATIGYAGARGKHLLRNTDANTAAPVVQADGSVFYPPGGARANPRFSTIEIKTSDGDSWYNAMILELRRSAAAGLAFQASYTLSRTIDTTQASTFFSDATNGTVSAMPEVGNPDYNKGLADFHAKHNLVANVTWDLPLGRSAEGVAKALLGGWQLSAIGQYRSGPPLTAFVQANRSRSLWSPSSGPGIGFDRPDLAPGRTPASAVTGDPDQWFDPTAFLLPAAGRLGTLGRGALIGPDLKVVDVALVKRIAVPRLGPSGSLELRVEAFNVLNRVNFGIPSLVAFAGQRDGESTLPTFGRIRGTTTPARQVQLGARVVF
ncbi:MAG TPA: TonB-dependent receptor, partial [Vicinamibacteria bacterium]|nr:TonB-dependent receptor [Vicinamibacteria bacterium]